MNRKEGGYTMAVKAMIYKGYKSGWQVNYHPDEPWTKDAAEEIAKKLGAEAGVGPEEGARAVHIVTKGVHPIDLFLYHKSDVDDLQIYG